MHFMGGADDPWKLFAETGNIYYYLDYKTHQHATDASPGKDTYATDSNDGACATASQSGGGGPDSDPSDP
ncbi:YqzL family protein [uncultured Gemmiger sp.]|uniref:YqzL family protein n=1 Tax=uncultured Gemmiger sp. TaxID=1623490 RepID=UPI00345B9409